MNKQETALDEFVRDVKENWQNHRLRTCILWLLQAIKKKKRKKRRK